MAVYQTDARGGYSGPGQVGGVHGILGPRNIRLDPYYRVRKQMLCRYEANRQGRFEDALMKRSAPPLAKAIHNLNVLGHQVIEIRDRTPIHRADHQPSQIFYDFAICRRHSDPVRPYSMTARLAVRSRV